MNKLKNIFYFIIFVFAFNHSNAGTYKLKLDNYAYQFINTIEINKFDYSSLDQIVSKIYKNRSYNLKGTNLKVDNYHLKLIPNSLFIMLTIGDSIMISQMQLPAIQYQNKLYVPISTFLNSLDSLGIYSVEEESNVFTLHSKMKNEPVKVFNFAYKSIPKLKMDVRNTTEPKLNVMNEISDSYSKLYTSLKPSFESGKRVKKATQLKSKKKIEIINTESPKVQDKNIKKSENGGEYFNLPKGLIRTEIENILNDEEPEKE